MSAKQATNNKLQGSVAIYLRCGGAVNNHLKKGLLPWASAHRGKWGQLTPSKNGWKIKQQKHAKKQFSEWGWGWTDTSDDWLVKLMIIIIVIIIDHWAHNYVYVIFWEQSGQAGVENGSMLTTYLFRYTSESTIS